MFQSWKTMLTCEFVFLYLRVVIEDQVENSMTVEEEVKNMKIL